MTSSSSSSSSSESLDSASEPGDDSDDESSLTSSSSPLNSAFAALSWATSSRNWWMRATPSFQSRTAWRCASNNFCFSSCQGFFWSSGSSFHCCFAIVSASFNVLSLCRALI